MGNLKTKIFGVITVILVGLSIFWLHNLYVVIGLVLQNWWFSETANRIMLTTYGTISIAHVVLCIVSFWYTRRLYRKNKSLKKRLEENKQLQYSPVID